MRCIIKRKEEEKRRATTKMIQYNSDDCNSLFTTNIHTTRRNLETNEKGRYYCIPFFLSCNIDYQFEFYGFC